MPTWNRQLLTAPNLITLFRLPLLAWCAWEASIGNINEAFVLFVLAWALDGVDGLAARLFKQASTLGYYLDKIIDRIVMAVGIVVLLRYNILPPIALFLIVRDIGYIPALYPMRDVRANWHGAGPLGKTVTLLQGVGFIWLFAAWPHPELIVLLTALLGGFVAIQHLRSFMVVLLLLSVPMAAQASGVEINEVMWDGTEYVEFFNSGDTTSLAGWKLTRQQSGGEEKTIIVFSDGATISKDGYFLLERTEAATTVPADAISGSLVLVQGGELVRLYDASETVRDSVDGSAGWPAGENTDVGIAMERSGSGWQTSSGSGGGRSGTPRAPNSSGTNESQQSGSNEDDSESNAGDISYDTPVIINEFLPNPAGDDSAGEFIELYNPSDNEADLSGWQLDDAPAGSGAYTLSAGTIVGAHAYVVLMRQQTGIALNNTGDEVRLLDPNGAVHAHARYSESAADGQSYNNASGTFVVSTTATPGTANVITKPAELETKSDSIKAATKPSPATLGAAQESGSYTTSVIVFRALPNPIGDDTAGEFIELKNTGSVPADLSGWQLDDEEGGSAPHTIPHGVTIAANDTLTFSREDTAIALNNNGDVVRLLAPDGTVISTLAYEDVAEGQVVEASNTAELITDSSSSKHLLAGAVAGIKDVAVAQEVDVATDQAHAGGPVAIAGLTDGRLGADKATDDFTDAAGSKTTDALIGFGLALAAAVVLILSFADKQTLRRWTTYFMKWRQS